MRITQDALQKIMRYPFPGNVRELENLIEGALALTTDPVVDPGDLLLPESAASADPEEMGADFPTLEDLQARYIVRVLAYTKGNISKAAKVLGISRKTLHRMGDLSQIVTSGTKWDIH